MRISVKPTVFLKGAVDLPSSKSYSIRSVIVAACGGRSTILNLSDCDDVVQAIKAASALGAVVKPFLSSRRLTVHARSPFQKNNLTINIGESGTVLRFLLPLLALRKTSSIVTGKGTLLTRPNTFLTQTLRAMGKEVRGQGAKETVPIVLSQGVLKGGKVEIDGSLSSQFISALLIACPLLQENTQLRILGKTMVSKPYVQMTQNILRKAGVIVSKKTDARYSIKGQQVFKGLNNFTVPSDYGLAAFLLAAAALIPSRVILKGFFDDQLIQADGQILAFLKKLGVNVKKQKHALSLQGPFVLNGGSFSLKDCPDLVPIMAVLALFAKRKTRLYHIAHARVKESDRIGDLRQELLKIGAKISEKKDELIICPQQSYKQNVVLDPHRDHRLAMAFAVLGLKIGVKIIDAECVAKSYPGFFEDLAKIKAVLGKA